MGERADNRLLQLAHVGQLLSLPVRFSGVSCDAVDLRARNTPAPAVASRVVGLHLGMSGLDRGRYWYRYRLLPHIIARVLTIGLDRPAISSGLIPSRRGNGRATAGTKFVLKTRTKSPPYPDLPLAQPGREWTQSGSLAGPNFRRSSSPRYQLTIPGRLDILLRVPTVRKHHEEGCQF